PVLRAVDDVGQHEETDEHERQDDRRVVREQAPQVAAANRLGQRRHPPLLPFCRMARPPIITTSTISVPWMTCAQFWSTPLMIRIVFTSVSTTAAAIGPIRPPTPPSSDTPPSTTAATELRV